MPTDVGADNKNSQNSRESSQNEENDVRSSTAIHDSTDLFSSLEDQVQALSAKNNRLLSLVDTLTSELDTTASPRKSALAPSSLSGLTALASFLSTTKLLDDPDRASRGKGARDFVAMLSPAQNKALLAAAHAREDREADAASSSASADIAPALSSAAPPPPPVHFTSSDVTSLLSAYAAPSTFQSPPFTIIPPAVLSRHCNLELLAAVLNTFGPDRFLSSLLRAHEYHEDGLFRVVLGGNGISTTDEGFWDALLGVDEAAHHRDDGEEEEEEKEDGSASLPSKNVASRRVPEEGASHPAGVGGSRRQAVGAEVAVAADNAGSLERGVARKSGWLERRLQGSRGGRTFERAYFTLFVGRPGGPVLARYASDRTTHVERGTVSLGRCFVVDTTPPEDPITGLKGVFSFEIRHPEKEAKMFKVPDKVSHSRWLEVMTEVLRDYNAELELATDGDLDSETFAFVAKGTEGGEVWDKDIDGGKSASSTKEKEGGPDLSTNLLLSPLKQTPEPAVESHQQRRRVQFVPQSRDQSDAEPLDHKPGKKLETAPPPLPRQNSFDVTKLPDSFWEPSNLFDPATLPESFWNPANLFELFDSNGDGTIDMDELLIGLTITLNKKVTVAEASHQMKLYDRDRSGGLDRAEFIQLVSDIKGGGAGKSFLKKLFSKSPSKKENETAVSNAKAIVLQAASEAAAKAVLSS